MNRRYGIPLWLWRTDPISEAPASPAIRFAVFTKGEAQARHDHGLCVDDRKTWNN